MPRTHPAPKFPGGVVSLSSWIETRVAGGCWPCADQMDAWADRFFGKAVFICVSCDGSSLAQTFVSNRKLKRCHVTVAVDGPAWGQLGCNGFIVLNGAGRVVCRATSPFMQVRELAFAHVEALVEALVAGQPPPPVCPGQQVVLRGLSKSELNGQPAICVEAIDPASGRCGVALGGGRRLAVKVANVQVMGDDEVEGHDSHDEDDEPMEGGGCAGGS